MQQDSTEQFVCLNRHKLQIFSELQIFRLDDLAVALSKLVLCYVQKSQRSPAATFILWHDAPGLPGRRSSSSPTQLLLRKCFQNILLVEYCSFSHHLQPYFKSDKYTSDLPRNWQN